MGLWRGLVTAQHVLGGKAVSQANRLQGDMGQFPRITCQDPQAITAPRQLPHQLNRPGGRF
ncbi:hypothetical protein D3C71_1891940 [compost metagenome]